MAAWHSSILKIRHRRIYRGPARNPKYLAWIRTLPCLVCERTPCHAAHTGSDGGTAQKPSDYSAVPLCADHHVVAVGAYHNSRIGKLEFERRHGISFEVEVQRLNAIWERIKPMETIKFTTDVPVQLTILTIEGQKVKGFRGTEYRFKTVDERAFYVDEESGRKLGLRMRELGIQPGDSIVITKESKIENKKWATFFTVFKMAPPVQRVGEQPDGSFVVPCQPGAGSLKADSPAPAQVTATTSSEERSNTPKPTKDPIASSPLEHSGTSLVLRDQTQMLVDVFASCLQYAQSRYGDLVRPEDIRSLMQDVYARQA